MVSHFDAVGYGAIKFGYGMSIIVYKGSKFQGWILNPSGFHCPLVQFAITYKQKLAYLHFFK